MFFKKKHIDYDAILRKYVDDDFLLSAAGKDAPDYNILKKLEKKYRIKFPADFKDFSTSPLAGIHVEIKEEVWPRPKPLEVGQFWSFLYAFFVYGLADDIPDWMNIDIQSEIFQREVNKNFVPFMKIKGDADVFCFSKNSLIYRWDHELDEFNQVKMSFAELLESELSELKARKIRKVQLTK